MITNYKPKIIRNERPKQKPTKAKTIETNK